MKNLNLLCEFFKMHIVVARLKIMPRLSMGVLIKMMGAMRIVPIDAVGL